jgi:hypothetical protein
MKHDVPPVLLFSGPCITLHGIRANKVMGPGVWILATGGFK